MSIVLNRRTLLKGAGALVVTFNFAPAALAASAEPGLGKTTAPDQVDGFLAIAGDGKVTLYSGKVELGTGVRTAMTQIAAEELDIPVEHITVIEGDTSLTPDQGPTSGSQSIQNGGMQIRHAAATARQAILTKAGKTFNVEPASLTVKDGIVLAKDGRQVPIGKLVGDAPLSLKLDPGAPTKSPADFHIVGQSMPRLDIPDKVMARFTYMQDFKLPDMLHARVIRPAGFGAQLQSYDETSIKDIPGIVKVVRRANFLAVVAQTEWAAIKAAQQMNVQWSNWQGLPDQAKIWDYVRASKIVKDDVTSKTGDTAAAFASAAKRLEATYDFAVQTHGSIGPSCAVALLEAGKLTCWTASQSTHNLRRQLAAMMAMDVADIRCIYIEGAGCYGRNGHEDAAADAALLTREMGKPVRVQWMRADEHGWDPKGPPTLMDLRAGIDAQGSVSAWETKFFYPNATGTNVDLVGADLAGLPSDAGQTPGGVLNNTAIPYDFPNVTTTAHRLQETPFKPSWIRAPGRMQNTFANEAFLDEIAAASGIDPLDIRLKHIAGDQRGVELLQRLADKSGWRSRPKADRQAAVSVGYGLAYVKYELVRTYVGAVAEVEVNRQTGEIHVRRFYITHDCGQIINPDGVRNQLEGGVLQTVSRTLKEEVIYDRSMITSLDWSTYPILTFPEIPEVSIDLIDRPTEKPWGVGEAISVVVAPAISNAVFDATGARLRSVPFAPEKVKRALQDI